MNKSYRQAQILKLVRRRNVRTQEELARTLASVGIQATQVTLSRDIKELGLVKTAGGYMPVREPSAGPALATVMAEFLTEVRQAQNLVVLKTAPGNANPVAVSLDRAEWPEVVGTVAGDDTVLVVAPDAATAGKLRHKLMRFLA